MKLRISPRKQGLPRWCSGDTRDGDSTPGEEDPPEREMTTYSSILAWDIPRTAWQATVHRVAKSQTQLSTHTCLKKQRREKYTHI